MKEFKVKNFNQPSKKASKTAHEGSLEEDVKNELNEYEQAFKDQMKKESEGIDNAVSTGYWFCAYFADVEQCQEFLKNAGLQNLMEGQYVNGQMMADKMGIKITKKKISPPPSFKKHKDFTSFSM
ncbi:MAG: hypothetical protein LBS55_06565 [Prevotellaceae bacterium]|jgi:hypothetical protein|nr:hypothetical protein [Prevotellaceae bacterium]